MFKVLMPLPAVSMTTLTGPPFAVSSIIGYKALGVDYSNDDGFLFNVLQQGPILGLVVRL